MSDLRDLLTWCRGNGFRVRDIEMGGVKLTVEDLRIDTPGKDEPGPRTVHGAWAAQLGVPYDDGADDEADA